MKDAKGHGSDPRGAHAEGVNQVGKVPTTQEFRKMARELDALGKQPNPDYNRIMRESNALREASLSMAPGTHPLLETPGAMSLGHISASRFYKGDGFSGWVVRNEEDRHHYTDPISNKTEAKEAMRDMYERTINTPGHHLPMG